MNERIKRPDKKNALSIINECFRMLGDAKLVSKGIVSKDHIEQIKELESISVETKRPIGLINNLRKLRHNINYYGYIPKKEEAEDAVSIAKDCFYPLLKEIKRDLEN